MRSGRITVIETPFDLGGDHKGAAEGPRVLRGAGLYADLATVSDRVYGIDLAARFSPLLRYELEVRPYCRPSSPMKHSVSVAEVVNLLDSAVSDELEMGNRVLSIGGDHSIAAGSLAAVRCHFGARVGLIWIDAHMDAHTTQTTPTGNTHGMPLAALLGHGSYRLVRKEARGGCFWKPEQVLLVGVSSYEEGEEKLLRAGFDTPVRIITMNEFVENGRSLPWLFYQFGMFGRDFDYLAATLDMDGVNWRFAPHVQYQNPNGFTDQEILNLGGWCASTGKVVFGEIVEVIARLNSSSYRTAKLAVELAVALMRQK